MDGFQDVKKSLNCDQFRNVIIEYIEPNIDLREEIMIFMQKRETLRNYYNKKNKEFSDDLFQLGDKFDDWKSSYKILWTKINNLILHPDCENMRTEIVELMNS